MEDRIKELEEALRTINLRLSRLEGSKPQATTAAPPMSSRVTPPKPEPLKKNDSTIGMSKLLAVVAVICFVLAATFIVKLAIESGWLTAERQWGMTIMLGAALAAAGRYLPVIDKEYRSYLSAAGLVVLYISAYSSSLYFDLVSEDMSLLFSMLVTVMGLFMFNYHHSEIFPIVSVVGTYLSLFLMNDYSMSFWFMSIQFTLWGFVFSWFSTHFRSRTINLLATYLGLGLYTYLNMNERNGDNILFVLLFLSIQFAVFTWGVAWFTLKNKVTLTKVEAWSYFPALCFFYGMIYFFINVITPKFAPWIGLGIALSFLAFYESIKTKLKAMDHDASKTMVHSFLALVIFQAGYLELMPDSKRVWLLPLIIIMNYLSEQKKDFPIVSRAFRILGLAISGIEFFNLLEDLMKADGMQAPLVAFITLGLGIFYYMHAGRLVQAKEKSYLSLVHILAIIALYRISFAYGSLAVSGAWALYAVFILSLGYFRKDRNLVMSSLIVLFFASFKALIYDGSGAPTSVRIGSLIFTGILLFGTGVLFRQMQHWQKKEA